MTAVPVVPFAAGLRTRPQPIRLGEAGAPTISVRVEMPEVWDAVRIDATPTTPVLDVKLAALGALDPRFTIHEDYAMKLRGWEVLDEYASLEDVGALGGSIFLLTHRRRRPVR